MGIGLPSPSPSGGAGWCPALVKCCVASSTFPGGGGEVTWATALHLHLCTCAGGPAAHSLGGKVTWDTALHLHLWTSAGGLAVPGGGQGDLGHSPPSAPVYLRWWASSAFPGEGGDLGHSPPSAPVYLHWGASSTFPGGGEVTWDTALHLHLYPFLGGAAVHLRGAAGGGGKGLGTQPSICTCVPALVGLAFDVCVESHSSGS